MKNAFEQLDDRVPGAAQCFEEVVSTILRATVPDAKRVRVHRGDNGVDTFTGTWGDAGELDVYQIKYFVRQWGNSQKQQIKNSYGTAAKSENYNLRKWYLIVPTDLTASDFKWFDEWRQGLPHEVEVINGAALSDRLRRSECSHARQMLRSWGVAGLDGGPSFNAWVRLLSDAPRFALVLNVWLHNTGDKSARSVRLRLQHSETHTLAHRPNEQWWRQTATSLNPWELECTGVINPDEKVPVIGIAFREMPAEEVWLRLRLTAEDMGPLQAGCRFSPAGVDFQKEQRVWFSAE